MLSLIRLEERETRMIFQGRPGFVLCAGLLLGADGGLLQVRLCLAAKCHPCDQPWDVRPAFDQAVENGVCDMKSRIVLQT